MYVCVDAKRIESQKNPCNLWMRDELRRQRSSYASQIVEQDLHVAQSRPIVQHATAQGEAAAERGIREIRTAVSLQRD